MIVYQRVILFGNTQDTQIPYIYCIYSYTPYILYIPNIKYKDSNNNNLKKNQLFKTDKKIVVI